MRRSGEEGSKGWRWAEEVDKWMVTLTVRAWLRGKNRRQHIQAGNLAVLSLKMAVAMKSERNSQLEKLCVCTQVYSIMLVLMIQQGLQREVGTRDCLYLVHTK